MMSLSNEGCRLVRFLTIAFVAAQLGSSVARADIVYTIDTTITSSDPTGNPLQTDTVDGSITTDGTIGVLTASNILSWNLDLTDHLNAANDVDLTNTNSFNYSAAGEFGIQEDCFYTSGEHYFCFSTGTVDCLAGETITPGNVFLDGVVATGSAEPIGTQPLNQSSVPEPSSYGLMLAGLLGVGGGLKRRFF